MTLTARYFDGRNPRPRPVELSLAGDRLLCTGEGVQRQLTMGELQLWQRLTASPPRLGFGDGAYVEITDGKALAALLAGIGHRVGVLALARRRVLNLLASLVAVVLLAFAGYGYALPAFIDHFAAQMPKEVLAAVSDELLDVLDTRYLQASQLPESRRRALQRGFASLMDEPQGQQLRFEIVFRAGKQAGPKALALPDGRIVLLDALVALAASDEEVIALLAHESRHAQTRDGLRALLRSNTEATASAWWKGDVRPLLALAPDVLLASTYPREREMAADAAAAAVLKAKGLRGALLASMLRRLEGAETSFGSGQGGWAGYLESPAATNDRIRRLEAGRPT